MFPKREKTFPLLDEGYDKFTGIWATIYIGSGLQSAKEVCNQ